MTSYRLTQEENTRYFESPEHPDYWWTVDHWDGQSRNSYFTWRAYSHSTNMPQIASGGAEGFHDGCRRALSAIDKHQKENKVSIRPLDNPFQSCPAPATCEECDNPKPHSGHGDPREEDVEFSAPSQCSVEPSF